MAQTETPVIRTIRMLSTAQRQAPMRTTHNGPFRNVAFHVGYVERRAEDPKGLVWLRLRADAAAPFPIRVPDGVPIPPSGEMVKIVGAVTGLKDREGRPHAVVVARSFERPNILEVKAKTVAHLYEKPILETVTPRPGETLDPEKVDRSKEAARSRNGANNEIHLAGMVVGRERRFGVLKPETGQWSRLPSITLFLRQDENPDIVIPVRCTSPNEGFIENIAKGAVWGALVYIQGEHALTREPRLRLDENGKPIPKMQDGRPLRENGVIQYEELRDDVGEIMYSVYSEIRTSVPRAAKPADITFIGDPSQIPEWIKRAIEEKTKKSGPGQGAVAAQAIKLDPLPGTMDELPEGQKHVTSGIPGEDFSDLLAGLPT